MHKNYQKIEFDLYTVNGSNLNFCHVAPSDDEKLRRIALAALITQSNVQGWNDELKLLLYAFRNDPSPMVAEKAQFTISPNS